MGRPSHPRRRALPAPNAGTAAMEPEVVELGSLVLIGPDDPAGLVPAAPDPTDHEIGIARAILERWNSGKRPNTQRERLADVRHLGSFAWGCDNPAIVLARMILAEYHGARAIVSRWHQSMIDAGLADTTRARRIVSIRGVIGTAARAGALRWTLYDVDAPRFKAYGRTSGPPWRDVERVLLALRDRGDWRSLALVLLLYDVGLRSREASGLMVQAIDMEAREIAVIRKGGTDPTIVRLTARTCEALRRTIAARPEKWRTRGPVFSHGFKLPRPWSHTAVRNVTIGLGLGKPHGLRHSLANRMIEATNGDVRAAQGALGHANVATTQVYIDTRLRAVQADAMATLDTQTGDGWIDGTSKQAKQGARERKEKQARGKQAAPRRGKGAQAAQRKPASARARTSQGARKASGGASVKRPAVKRTR